MTDEEKKYIYPIVFKDPICPHCGANAIKYKNEFDKLTKETDLYRIKNMVCEKCEREFFIKWEESDGKYVPRIVSFEEVEKYQDDIIKFMESNKRKLLV